MKYLTNKYFYIGLLGLFLLIFLLQNTSTVAVNFLFWNLIEINLFFIMFLFLLIGFFLGLYAKSKFEKKRNPHI